ncbi:MAG TPA: potassium transporter TrkG, partial [Acidimicrobiales bacterium]|nr:potassium transporter TrkG [Acidimicrobiales bacterium]
MAILFVAAGMAVATSVAMVDGRDAIALATATAVTGLIGLALFHVAKPDSQDQAAVFSAVGTTWLVASLLGALPYLLAGTFAVAGRPWAIVLADSLFESISGFSCTGSTVFGSHNPIEAQGSGILMYRQLTQWAGGMGIVVLVVMVLPSLRSSGLGLIDAEAPGMGVDRLAPRISTTAVWFWGIYAGFTVLVALGLFGAGMGPFDAVAHAL